MTSLPSAHHIYSANTEIAIKYLFLENDNAKPVSALTTFSKKLIAALNAQLFECKADSFWRRVVVL